MKKYQKIILAVSGFMILGGGILGVAGIAMGGSPGFAITKSGVKTMEEMNDRGEYIEKTVALTNVKNLEINCTDGLLEILEGEDFHLEYGYYGSWYAVEEKKEGADYHLYSTYNNHVSVDSSFSMFDLNVFLFDEQEKENYIRVYIPKGTKLKELKFSNEYGNIQGNLDGINVEHAVIQQSDGQVLLSGMKAEAAEIGVEYGNLDMKDCQIETLKLDNESGVGVIENLISNQMDIQFGFGDLHLTELKVDTINCTNEDGGMYLNDVTGKNLTLALQYGRLELEQVQMEESISLKSGNEKISLQDIQTAALNIETEYGDLSGNRIKADSNLWKFDSGNCEVSELTVQNLEIQNEYGMVSLELTEEESAYDFLIDTEYGEITINDQQYEGSIVREKGAKNRIQIEGETIEINTK